METKEVCPGSITLAIAPPEEARLCCIVVIFISPGVLVMDEHIDMLCMSGHLRFKNSHHVRGVFSGLYSPFTPPGSLASLPSCMGTNVVNVYVNLAAPQIVHYIRSIVEWN